MLKQACTATSAMHYKGVTSHTNNVRCQVQAQVTQVGADNY